MVLEKMPQNIIWSKTVPLGYLFVACFTMFSNNVRSAARENKGIIGVMPCIFMFIASWTNIMHKFY